MEAFFGGVNLLLISKQAIAQAGCVEASLNPA